MNGTDLIKEIRKKYINNPIIAESSYLGEIIAKKSHNFFCHIHYLQKPYNDSELENAINIHFLNNKNFKKSELVLFAKDKYLKFDLDCVLYIEKIGGTTSLKIVTCTSEKKVSESKLKNYTLKKIEEKIIDETLLLRCHKSFLVNPQKIQEINWVNNSIILNVNNIELLLGGAYRSKIGNVIETISKYTM
jgi:DNA-binding LytR/AlgR family response regulator